MNALGVAQVALGIVVFVGVVARLATMQCAGTSLGCRASFNVWATAHVLVALGAVCLAMDLNGHALGLTFTGLALYFGLRLRNRRDTDR